MKTRFQISSSRSSSLNGMSGPSSSGVKSGPWLAAAVVEDLRARAAGAGDAHRPVVLLLPEPEDALRREAGDLAPQVHRLGVVGVDGRVELALLEPPAAVGCAAW